MKLAIIVSYRNREEHLKKFLEALPAYLNKRNFNYKIFIAEQKDDELFNEGILFNATFDIIKNDFDYFCFHVIDTIPEDDKADYSYPEKPVRVGVYDYCKYEKRWGYGEKKQHHFGNIVIFNKEDFIKINGYSNEYPGWGRHDGDLYYRCIFSGLEPYVRISKFKHLPHQYSKPYLSNKEENTKRLDKMIKRKIDYKKEGLNTVRYEILNIEEFDRYTKIDLIFKKQER